jgi:hypothetical protein
MYGSSNLRVEVIPSPLSVWQAYLILLLSLLSLSLSRHLSSRDLLSTFTGIGTQGCITPIHYDRCHGFLTQERGKKVVTLFSPKHTKYLYPQPTFSSAGHTSRVLLKKINDPSTSTEELAKFPLFAKARQRVVELHVGEMLYIPPGWYLCHTPLICFQYLLSLFLFLSLFLLQVLLFQCPILSLTT